MFVHLLLPLLWLLLLPADVVVVKRGEDWMYSSMFPATDKPLLKRAIKAASKGKDALKFF